MSRATRTDLGKVKDINFNLLSISTGAVDGGVGFDRRTSGGVRDMDFPLFSEDVVFPDEIRAAGTYCLFDTSERWAPYYAHSGSNFADYIRKNGFSGVGVGVGPIHDKVTDAAAEAKKKVMIDSHGAALPMDLKQAFFPGQAKDMPISNALFVRFPESTKIARVSQQAPVKKLINETGENFYKELKRLKAEGVDIKSIVIPDIFAAGRIAIQANAKFLPEWFLEGFLLELQKDQSPPQLQNIYFCSPAYQEAFKKIVDQPVYQSAAAGGAAAAVRVDSPAHDQPEDEEDLVDGLKKELLAEFAKEIASQNQDSTTAKTAVNRFIQRNLSTKSRETFSEILGTIGKIAEKDAQYREFSTSREKQAPILKWIQSGDFALELESEVLDLPHASPPPRQRAYNPSRTSPEELEQRKLAREEARRFEQESQLAIEREIHERAALDHALRQKRAEIIKQREAEESARKQARAAREQERRELERRTEEEIARAAAARVHRARGPSRTPTAPAAAAAPVLEYGGSIVRTDTDQPEMTGVTKELVDYQVEAGTNKVKLTYDVFSRTAEKRTVTEEMTINPSENLFTIEGNDLKINNEVLTKVSSDYYGLPGKKNPSPVIVQALAIQAFKLNTGRDLT